MNVLFIDSVHPVMWKKLEASGFICVDGVGKSRTELLPLLKNAEGIVIRSRFLVDEELLSQAPELQFIARSGSGMENIDIEAAKKRNIKLFNSPEGNCDAVGEHSIALILSLINHICRGNQEVRKLQWNREKNRGRELGNMTIGIIGYGHTGSSLARKLRGFECKVLAHDKYKKNFSNEFVEEATVAEIQSVCDIISLHLPYSDETHHYLDKDFIGKMARPFYVINTSRGKCVNTKDLVEGLQSQNVVGAGLDVLELEKSSFEKLDFDQLPKEYEQLMCMDNVVLSPHVAGWTVESYVKLSEFLADKILEKFGD